MNFTDNYQLRKPSPNEYYDIEDANYNADVVDGTMSENERLLTAHSADGSVHVTPEMKEAYDIAFTELVAHTEDEGVHVTAAQKTAWTQGAETAAANTADIIALQNTQSSHEARLARLEDALFSNITGNPWAVAFDTLTGITITKGCWNVAQQRIEC